MAKTPNDNYFKTEGLNKRTIVTIDYLCGLPDKTLVNAGDVARYLTGNFGEDDSPEDKIKKNT